MQEKEDETKQIGEKRKIEDYSHFDNKKFRIIHEVI